MVLTSCRLHSAMVKWTALRRRADQRLPEALERTRRRMKMNQAVEIAAKRTEEKQTLMSSTVFCWR